jgi:hypothetical protein
MEDTRKTIADLPKLQRPQLLDLWRFNFGREAPEGIRRELMIPVLAYRIQERAHGGLSRESLTNLKLAGRGRPKDFGCSPAAEAIKSGTQIIRQWRGETHEVAAIEGGFKYRGDVYKTLSETARKITGTRWSGPLFFGLRKKGARGRR